MRFISQTGFLLLLTILVVVSTASCKRNRVEPMIAVLKPEDQHMAQFLEYYKSAFKTHLLASECPGAAVAIVKDSNIVFLNGFGVKSAGGNDSIDANTIFRIGSLSKGFTSVLVGILVEKGLLNWNEHVSTCLHDFCLKDSVQSDRISIAHLLSHSSGLPRHTFTNLLEDGIDIHEARNRLKEVDLLGEEGKVFAYQNLAYSIIEEMIQQKSGKTYNEFLKEYIFKKGRMESASISYEDLMACPNKSMPHNWTSARGFVSVPFNQKYYNAVSAGGINMSITDMASWLQILLGNRKDIVADSTLDHIFTPFIRIPDKDYYDMWDGVQSSSYGMGWRVLNYANKELIYHAGFVNDFRSEIAIDRVNNIGICVLFNAQNSYARHVVPTFFNYYEMYKSCFR